jgi:hypothetical protein
MLPSRAEVDRQTVYRSDEVSNGTERRRLSVCRIGSELESFPNNVGLGDLASTRFGFDIGKEWFGQPYCQGFHGVSVLHMCQQRNAYSSVPTCEERLLADIRTEIFWCARSDFPTKL